MTRIRLNPFHGDVRGAELLTKLRETCLASSWCQRRATTIFLDKEGSQEFEKSGKFNLPGDIPTLAKNGGRVAGFACQYHEAGVDAFWRHDYRRFDGEVSVEIPQVKFRAYDEYGQYALHPEQKEAKNLDTAMRFLRRRRMYARLDVVVPAILNWGDEKTLPEVIGRGVNIGWTDGVGRFELVHPRIIWGDELRLPSSTNRFELASEHPDHRETLWLGRIVA